MPRVNGGAMALRPASGRLFAIHGEEGKVRGSDLVLGWGIGFPLPLLIKFDPRNFTRTATTAGRPRSHGRTTPLISTYCACFATGHRSVCNVTYQPS